MIWTDCRVSFSFGKGGCGVLVNYSFWGVETTLSYLASPVCSSFSAKACAIVQALLSAAPTSLPFLLLLDSYSVLSSFSYFWAYLAEPVCLFGDNGSLTTCFFRAITQLIRQKCAICNLSPLVPPYLAILTGGLLSLCPLR